MLDIPCVAMTFKSVTFVNTCGMGRAEYSQSESLIPTLILVTIFDTLSVSQCESVMALTSEPSAIVLTG